MRIIAVIAAYNEEKRVAASVADALKYVDAAVVVDDCSRDNTAAVALAVGAHVLRHIINRGQGAAIQTGADYALQVLEADIIVHFDADGQMQASEIPDLVAPIAEGKVDVVFGSRFLGKVAQNMPYSRLLTLKLARLFTWLVSGVLLADTHCGFRALSRKAALKMRFTLDRQAHASQVFDLVKINHLSYMEVPVTILYTSATLAKGTNIFDGFGVLKDFFKHKFFGH